MKCMQPPAARPGRDGHTVNRARDVQHGFQPRTKHSGHAYYAPNLPVNIGVPLARRGQRMRTQYCSIPGPMSNNVPTMPRSVAHALRVRVCVCVCFVRAHVCVRVCCAIWPTHTVDTYAVARQVERHCDRVPVRERSEQCKDGTTSH